MKAWSRVICASIPVASCPASSYDAAGRATPPVRTSFTWRRTTSSLAMFRALVTTVSAGGPGALRAQIGPDGQRPGDRGGRGAAVQTPHHGTRLHQARRRVGDPLLLRSVACGLVAERKVVRDGVDHGAAVGTGDHLLARRAHPGRVGWSPADTCRFSASVVDIDDSPVLGQRLQQSVRAVRTASPCPLLCAYGQRDRAPGRPIRSCSSTLRPSPSPRLPNTGDEMSSDSAASTPYVSGEIANQPELLAPSVGRHRAVRRRAPGRGSAGRGGRLRHVLVHGDGVRRAARGRRRRARPTHSPARSSRRDASTTVLVVISRSGTTTEVLDLIAHHLDPDRRDHRDARLADPRARRPHDRARLRRRAVRRTDPVRDQRRWRCCAPRSARTWRRPRGDCRDGR